MKKNIKRISINIINLVKENILFLLFYVALLIAGFYRLDFVVYSGGGIGNIYEKSTIENQTNSEGSFNLAFVVERPGTLLTLGLSYIFDWERASVNNISYNNKETIDDVGIRDHIYLDVSMQTAAEVAYKKAGKTFEIENTEYKIIYIDEKSDTDLKIGDIVLSANNQELKELDLINKIRDDLSVGEMINFKVKRNSNTINTKAKIFEEEDKKYLGIVFSPIYQYKTDPKISFNFDKDESGPSGGLMLSLSIYDKLTSEDITKGRTIVGTGGVDQEGNIYEMGGIKYKLSAAVKNKADIFMVAKGNLEESLQLKKENNYQINIIGISTFDEAINVLKNS